ncbi:hypothetical protein M409DRAFT_22256 [Zasmidium cellare ATCC 36951]|uniref:IBR domain-containing protein n=1 Tax=Zasmidium cellare ATCC 36951 TaxID=1080233 RepID=A0A6A6CMK9_ZASCE|nr:uncharacterized protein M409DRAFT_22256 [Zasmidium cellare ATCC 36951]KAF2167448.1 hypothetical protein M409DRAFT_22256 [Zasmidium cellare ATCC 36951]
MPSHFFQGLKELIANNRNQDAQEARARARLTPKPTHPTQHRRRNNQKDQRRDAEMPTNPPRYTVVTQPHQVSTHRLLSQAFQCKICFKPAQGTGIQCGSPDTKLCSSCFTLIVVRLFERALHNDSIRPVTVDGNPLDINDFAHTIEMPFELILRWRERENERKQPMKAKVYCKREARVEEGPCGNFLGLKTKQVPLKGCQACRVLICSRCGHAVVLDGKSGRHVCDTEDDVVEEPRIRKLNGEKVFGTGELFDMGQRDIAGAGRLTQEERKEMLWAWLEGVEPFNDGRERAEDPAVDEYSLQQYYAANTGYVGAQASANGNHFQDSQY